MEVVSAESGWGFHERAEKLNGRMAMLGFIALLATEFALGGEAFTRGLLSLGTHSRSRNGRVHRWDVRSRRRRCKTANCHGEALFPLAPCSDSPGMRISEWWASQESWSWALLTRDDITILMPPTLDRTVRTISSSGHNLC
jgi:hypothetical protein